ncbi:MAG: O-antigen polymerase [Elusimicrobia bacterium]|nr:MAG: O-antigen polymerase [Elusimicrobiota bacterium]KAF0154489.1 MAG: O-antigen polymerase [Elusimicrobiota bacterium]
MSAIYLVPFVAAAPLLQGVMDPRLQAFFQVLAVALLALDFYRRGKVSAGPLTVLLAAAVLSALSVYFSPAREAVRFEWGALAAGFCLFLVSRGQSVRDRALTDRALRAAAWGVAAFALYQAFVLRSPNITSTLINPNALAFFLLLAGPVAVSRGDFVLTAVLALVFFLTGSFGALLALIAAAAVMALIRLRKSGDRRMMVVLGALSLAAVLALTQSDFMSADARLQWWRSALSMIKESPLLGWGHSSYTWLAPLYKAPAAAEASIYAHNYYLEFAAENGIPAALAWFSLLGFAVSGARRLALFGLLAALVHSAVDFGLSLPANFWLFCVLAGRELPAAEEEWAALPGAPAAAFAGTLAAASALSVITPLAWEREMKAAASHLEAGREEAALAALDRAAARPYGRSAAEESAGRLRFSRAMRSGGGGELFLAAVDFEKALLETPSRVTSAAALRAVYARAGAPALAAHPRLGGER